MANNRLLTEAELHAAYMTVDTKGGRTFCPKEMMAAAKAQDAKTARIERLRFAKWKRKAKE